MHGGYEFVQLGDILTTRLLFECWSLGAKEYIVRTFDLCCISFFMLFSWQHIVVLNERVMCLVAH